MWYGSWKCAGVLGLTSVLIVAIVMGWEHWHTHREKRELNTQDACLKKYGGIELVYRKGQNTGFRFDLCAVIPCGGKNSLWRGYDVYICGLGWPGNQKWCPTWDYVWKATNLDWRSQTRKPDGTMKTSGYFSLQRDYDREQNPVTLSIMNLTQNPYSSRPAGSCWGEGDNFYVLVGMHITGKDPLGLIKVTLTDAPRTEVTRSPKRLRTDDERLRGLRTSTESTSFITTY